MKIKVKKKSLSNLLQIASGIVQRRNTMPILANVKLLSASSELKIFASDLEVSLIGKINADVEAGGSIAVGARVLADVVRDLPGEDILINASNSSRLEISAGKANFKINCASGDEFPAIVGCELEKPISVEARKIFDMLDSTAYAVSTDETRFNINGICIESGIEDNNQFLRFISTDGHRLAIVDRDAEGIALDNSVIIPRKSVSDLKKVLENNEGAAQVSFSEGYFSVFSKDLVNEYEVNLGIRLIDGQFPSYKEALPRSVSSSIKVSREEFLATVKRVALVSTDRNKALKLDVLDSSMTISSSSPEYGEAIESVSIEKQGDDASIGFSASYLIDLLNSLSGKEMVKIELSGDEGPGLFTAEDDDRYRAVLMPMKFK